MSRALEASGPGAGAVAPGGPVHWVARCEETDAADPLDVFAGAVGERFYWERPEEDLALAGVGAVHAIEVRGADRFATAEREARALFAALEVTGSPPPGVGPLLVGGFAFADVAEPTPGWQGFPAGRLVLPERLVVRVGRRSWCTRVSPHAAGREGAAAAAARLALAREPADAAGPSGSACTLTPDPLPEIYRARVDEALGAIAAGALEKVVVARSVRLARRTDFDPVRLLAKLRRAHPSCATFAVGRGDAVWLGSTPERLLRLSAGRLEAWALAGSVRRGRSPEEDRDLARRLVESKKEQSEHALVVRALRAALEPHCPALHGPEAPRLRRLEGIQHLETRLEGRLRGAPGLLALAGELHPTPAVAGTPRADALDWIRRHESLARGWYAGPLGFVDASGGGELAVGLRSVLLRGSTAQLFAGAGIVEGSHPLAELDETRAKLDTLLAPLLEI